MTKLNGPLKVTRAVLDIQRMPDGSPIPSSLKHALIVLASYSPNIWPSQALLARDMSITRPNVNKRFRLLEDAGLITRRRRGRRSTIYYLNLKLIRLCIGSDPFTVSVPIQEEQIRTKKQNRPAVFNRPEDKPEPALPVNDSEDDFGAVDW
jgi:biotin operon repressor